MRNIFIGFFIFFALASFRAYAIDCPLPSNQYWNSTGSTSSTGNFTYKVIDSRNGAVTNYTPPPSYSKSCGSYDSSETNKNIEGTSETVSGYFTYYKYSIKTTIFSYHYAYYPTCTAPKVLDTIPYPPVCLTPCATEEHRIYTTTPPSCVPNLPVCDNNTSYADPITNTCVPNPPCEAPSTLKFTSTPPVCTEPVCQEDEVFDTSVTPNKCSKDTDGDGIPNDTDTDIDGDGIPNTTDTDIDGDGIPNSTDTDINGDGTPNTEDKDMDSDGISNANDTDIDGDGTPNTEDKDMDGDGTPNNQDTDMDGDGTANAADIDTDGDGILNGDDSDTDGDGIPNESDNADMDGDGIPNDIDTDIDGDGVVNEADSDMDGDGFTNEADVDTDGDGIPNGSDNSSNGLSNNLINSGSDADMDGDGTPNYADTDIDGDGTPNATDTDIDGDGISNEADSDTDGDGISNSNDLSSYGSDTNADTDGDGISNIEDTDIDGDGIPNDIDADMNGNNIPNDIDTDTDGDGIPNNIDTSSGGVGTSTGTGNNTIDTDGNGIPNVSDTDIDGDGIPNATDTDMNGNGTPNNQDSDMDGDGIPNESDSSSGGTGSGSFNPTIETCTDPQKTYSVSSEKCICTNGAPEVYNPATGSLICQVPKCVAFDDASNLPLFKENVTSQYCDSLQNTTLNFKSKYYSTSGLSCCYSNTAKSPNDTCPKNQILDKNGVCQLISDNNSTQCLDNYTWSDTLQKCIIFLPDQQGEFNGTLESNNSTPTPDLNGSATNDGTINIEDDFNPDESWYDNLFQDANNKAAEKVTSELLRVESTFLSIHTISIPKPNSDGCGCVDEVINVSVKGHTFNKTVEACQYIKIVFETMKYLLWLLATYGLILKVREIV